MNEQTQNDDFENELRSLVTDGNRLEAVKRFRKHTGAGLNQAAEAVDALAREQGISQRQSDSVEWDVLLLLESGQKIQAIKFYRQRMGSGLREAKQAVERIAAEHNISTPRGAGCFSVIALAVVSLLGTAIASI
jgi:ribosomal protein L7/L12